MAESLTTHADNLADYLNDHVLDEDRITRDGILDALASLGLTLVETSSGVVPRPTPRNSTPQCPDVDL